MDAEKVKTKKCNTQTSTSADHKKKGDLFNKPFKKVLIDLELFSLINTGLIYAVLFIIPDTTVAMVGAIWVGIIAWRGGVVAGMLACTMILFSDLIGMKLPPHNDLPLQYYFNNRVPGFFIGFLQCILCGSVVGYISTLVHRLEKEISLRKQVQKDLEQKVAELDAFGHTVAHDLKNPLMVINMSIDALVKEFVSSDNSKAKKKLAFINDGAKHMINIIESILMLAGVKKINGNEFTIFPISQSVDEALKRMEYNIETNGVKVSKPETWPSVLGYAPWITEVWVNYINNAIKYGGNGAMQIKPVIELGYDKPVINLQTNSEYIRFWVKDNGEGIAKDKASTLFNEFTRLHTTEHEGHGLGLSIVKSVIDKFEGNVGVESEIGKGSCFYFTLPAKMTKCN
jgi:signal transduction histidine kinase